MTAMIPGKNNQEQRLHILWTSGDLFTANSMVLLYATNGLLKDWWDEVTVILWGDSVRLVMEHEGIRDKIRMAANVGVRFSACSASARQMGADDCLKELGVQVKSWGRDLTTLLQSGSPLLTI